MEKGRENRIERDGEIKRKQTKRATEKERKKTHTCSYIESWRKEGKRDIERYGEKKGKET